jgi:flagellar assembly protein FliH
LSNKFIPKEQLSAYQRWELSAFDGPDGPEDPPPAEDVPVVTLPTAEEIERIHQQAHQEGFASGHQEGFSRGYGEGREKAVAEAQRLVQLVTVLDESLQGMDQQLSQDMLTLALDIAKQMLRQALAVRPELVLSVVREAMASLPQAGQHPHLILHPEDALLVRELMEDELAHFHWRIIEDARVERGGCRIETANSEIDATLESRWQRVISALGRDGSWLA